MLSVVPREHLLEGLCEQAQLEGGLIAILCEDTCTHLVFKQTTKAFETPQASITHHQPSTASRISLAKRISHSLATAYDTLLVGTA